MHMSDLVYMLHQMRDVLVSIWELSPPVIALIGIVLVGVIYFAFKR